MRRIVGVDGDTVTVQPGVVLGQLNRYLANFGRQFGPDPATGGVTTMGSVWPSTIRAATGCGTVRPGSMWSVCSWCWPMVKYWKSRRIPLPTIRTAMQIPRRRDLVRRLAELVEREQAIIRTHQPKAWVNRCGLSPVRRAPRRATGSGPAARGQRRDAGFDHASDAAHGARFRGTAAWRCCFSTSSESAATAAIEARRSTWRRAI